MLKLLERNIESIEQRLVLLAPPGASVPGFFKHVAVNPERHDGLVREMQQMRGSIYLNDGAVQPHQLSFDGRHETAEDDRSWHLLTLNRQLQVSACAWYLKHSEPKSIDSLRVRTCPLAATEGWQERFRMAVESELTRARESGLRYAEVGGWAVAKHSCCNAEGLLLALAAYSLGRAFGGSLGLTTATVRHGSSTILRRLGGSHLAGDGFEVPPYFDPKYGCEMEVLRFDSRQPSPKYAGLIDRLKDRLANVTVIARAADAVQQTGLGSRSHHPVVAA